MLVDLIKQGTIFDRINFSDHSILSYLTEDEGGPVILMNHGEKEDCFSLYVSPKPERH